MSMVYPWLMLKMTSIGWTMGVLGFYKKWTVVNVVDHRFDLCETVNWNHWVSKNHQLCFLFTVLVDMVDVGNDQQVWWFWWLLVGGVKRERLILICDGKSIKGAKSHQQQGISDMMAAKTLWWFEIKSNDYGWLSTSTVHDVLQYLWWMKTDHAWSRG